MKPRKKPELTRSQIQARASACTEKVLEACAQLPSLGGEAPVLREYVAESARKIFQAEVAGMLVRDGDNYQLGAVSAAVQPGRVRRPCCLTPNHLPLRPPNRRDCLTSGSPTATWKGRKFTTDSRNPWLPPSPRFVLLMVRSTVFAAVEVSAFSVLGIPPAWSLRTRS